MINFCWVKCLCLLMIVFDWLFWLFFMIVFDSYDDCLFFIIMFWLFIMTVLMVVLLVYDDWLLWMFIIIAFDGCFSWFFILINIFDCLILYWLLIITYLSWFLALSVFNFLDLSNFLHWVYFGFGSLYFCFGLVVYFFFGYFSMNALVIYKYYFRLALY